MLTAWGWQVECCEFGVWSSRYLNEAHPAVNVFRADATDLVRGCGAAQRSVRQYDPAPRGQQADGLPPDGGLARVK